MSLSLQEIMSYTPMGLRRYVDPATVPKEPKEKILHALKRIHCKEMKEWLKGLLVDGVKQNLVHVGANLEES